MRVKNAIDLGAEIKNRRKELGVTQSDLAEKTGLSASFISNIENGKDTAEIGKVMLLLSVLGLNMFVETR